MNLESFLQIRPNATSLEAREYVQKELLKRIAASPLKTILAFKEETALHLIYRMDRFSEDLDFSVTQEVDDRRLAASCRSLLTGEEITDAAIKRRTILLEIRQVWRERSFRVKIEINTGDLVPGELKRLFAELEPISFTLQIMRSDWLVAQKVRALLQRTKARDLYDLWFILRTRLPIDLRLVSKITGIDADRLPTEILGRIDAVSERQIVTDLNPFLAAGSRAWTRRDLKRETDQLFRAVVSAVQ